MRQQKLLDVGPASPAVLPTSPCRGGAWGNPLACLEHEGRPIDPKTARCLEGKGRRGPFSFDPALLAEAAAQEENP